MSSASIHTEIDRLFRIESGKMVSVLVKIFGTEHYNLAEDVVQDALISALETWKFRGVPDNPKAWLYRAARNKAIDIIRKNKHEQVFDFTSTDLQLLNSGYTFRNTMENLWDEDNIKDDFLAMMFACCHPDISLENQITFILKSLCGFSTKEIARAFITSEDTISKRIYRTKEYFRKTKIRPTIPQPFEIPERTDAVLQAIYMVFNEGYNATNSESLIREDVIEQALRLGRSLTESVQTQLPKVYALMALMCFHTARVNSRISSAGEIILLPFQDRKAWDYKLIEAGNLFMNKSATGNTLSVYHLEAAISYLHCSAKTYEETNWPEILECYNSLIQINPNPVTELNRCVAILELHGANSAMDSLQAVKNVGELENYPPYHAIIAKIHEQLGNLDLARSSLEQAISQSHSNTEKTFFKNKILKLGYQ